MKGIYITPIQKAFYRGPGEFDMASRGIHSAGISLPYPTPATLSGLVASYIGGSGSSNSSAWIDEYKEVLGKEFRLRGPFIVINGDYYLIHDLKNKFIFKISGPPLKIKLKENKIDKDYVKGIDIINIYDERVGIGLRVRMDGRKIVREGMLYTISLLDVENMASRVNKERLTLSYYVEYIGLDKDVNGIFRVGGESWPADVETEDLSESKFKEYFNIEARNLGLYVVSPLLLKTGIIDIEKFFVSKLSKLNVSQVKIIGETKLLAAGYASKLNNRFASRRPIFEALQPGSVIYLETRDSPDPNKLIELYYEGLGEYSSLGYGTIFPIQLEDDRNEEE